MTFFRHFKSIEELLPGFMMEKETEVSHKVAFSYHSTVIVLTDWLDENGISKLLPLRKIAPETMGYKFYSFKHTGATNLHMSGISMRELMDQLRHTKLDATQHYLKKYCGIVNERIKNCFPSPI